jgi:hypothetical protein
VDLTNLPANLQGLYLSPNLFNGTVDLTQLPAGLMELDSSYNRFSGLCELELDGNQFCVEVMSALPARMLPSPLSAGVSPTALISVEAAEGPEETYGEKADPAERKNRKRKQRVCCLRKLPWSRVPR